MQPDRFHRVPQDHVRARYRGDTRAIYRRLDQDVPSSSPLALLLAAPDEDVQASGDNRPFVPELMERVKPGAAFEFGDSSDLDGHLGTTFRHAAVEAAQLSLERKEATHTDVHDASTLEEQRQLSNEPAVDRRRIRGRRDNAPRKGTIGMAERGHIAVEVEDAETTSRP